MPQVSRALKRVFLSLMPEAKLLAYLEKHPNARKAAPKGMQFVFDGYLGKFRVNIDTKYKVERIMWTGKFEEKLVALASQRVSEGSVCFDVGGNVGAISIALADKVGDSGRVHTFELNPTNFGRLSANLAHNPELEKRVTLNNVGISDQPGTLFWSEDPGNPGNGMLGEKGDIESKVISLDSYCVSNAIEKIDFMKVDVEGMELQVFRGAENALKRFKPTIYFETLSRFSSDGNEQLRPHRNLPRVPRLRDEQTARRRNRLPRQHSPSRILYRRGGKIKTAGDRRTRPSCRSENAAPVEDSPGSHLLRLHRLVG
ncbi:FkbM family methyltransferase [Pelagicoccus sp. NFK12]|uniref:FkbM family methyltransferase n=1 Tax=Pelagicoccus enzymogenes TaxID=2773457 RepID=A0A927F7P4_9BACT|nr:FkbM family methyltransferase [Pelagicoccus enzymogenes]MBD5779246.1 FkbM family methyltransferase [Pelagicoccus enzymogenes]